MKTFRILISLVVVSLIAFSVIIFKSNSIVDIQDDNKLIKVQLHVPALDMEPLQVDNYIISNGTTHENLQVFLFKGEEMIKGERYVTLSDALNKKFVRVKETSSVNELSIDNLCDKFVFIHSGDIVKGGKQDRTISYDIIVPPKSKNVKLASFCVERGRWSQRQNESSHDFKFSQNIVSSKEIRMSAKYMNDQGEVWEKVDEHQDKISKNVAKKVDHDVDVKSGISESSLQLSLENEDLKKVKKEFDTKFKSILAENNEAIGLAYAINGEIYSVDVYNNAKLFKDLWDKLIDAMIIEAISEKDTIEYIPITKNDIKEFILAINEKPKLTSQQLNKATKLKTIEADSSYLLFTTIDCDLDTWVHKNYMQAETERKNGDAHIRNIRQQIQEEIINE
ncbi:ARPP-1 family domain-containing protein [Bacteroidota bacterium]